MSVWVSASSSVRIRVCVLEEWGWGRRGGRGGGGGGEQAALYSCEYVRAAFHVLAWKVLALIWSSSHHCAGLGIQCTYVSTVYLVYNHKNWMELASKNDEQCVQLLCLCMHICMCVCECTSVCVFVGARLFKMDIQPVNNLVVVFFAIIVHDSICMWLWVLWIVLGAQLTLCSDFVIILFSAVCWSHYMRNSCCGDKSSSLLLLLLL